MENFQFNTWCLKNQQTFIVHIHIVWKMKVPLRMKIFAWLLFYKKILTAENLMKRGWNLPSMCVQCRKEGETIKHLFTECTFTMIIYEAVTRPMGLTIGNWRVIFKEMEVPNWIVSKKSRIKKREIPLNILFVC